MEKILVIVFMAFGFLSACDSEFKKVRQKEILKLEEKLSKIQEGLEQTKDRQSCTSLLHSHHRTAEKIANLKNEIKTGSESAQVHILYDGRICTETGYVSPDGEDPL